MILKLQLQTIIEMYGKIIILNVGLSREEKTIKKNKGINFDLHQCRHEESS